MQRGLCIALALLLQCAVQAAAQTYADWLWGFGGQLVVSDEFEECQSVPLVIIPPASNASAVGVPPYYLLAFEPGGVPTTTMVGRDPKNLTWIANHKQGAKLMLTMMDSQQRIGGVPGTLYTMTAGSDSSCIPTAPQNVASVHANVTDALHACDAWGLTIQGGQKPYTVVISGLDLPTIQNETLGANDNVFTYVDRVKPNTQLMASVVDATGQWGTSSQLIRTAGSTDTKCIAPGVPAHPEAKGMNIQVIVGLAVGLSVPIAVAIAAIVWFIRRRRARARRERDIRERSDIISTAWEAPDNAAEPNMREVPGQARRHAKGPVPTNKPFYEVTPLPAVYFDREFGQAGSASGSNNNTGSTFYSDPYSSVSGRSVGADLTLPLRASMVDSDGLPDIYVQHRDGGVVQELPPPYADASMRAKSSPTPVGNEVAYASGSVLPDVGGSGRPSGP